MSQLATNELYTDSLEERHLRLLSDPRIKTAVNHPQENPLCSGIKPLDNFLHGGLKFSSLIEWGMPFGSGARRLVVMFMAHATGGGRKEAAYPLPHTEPLWCLWISARQQLLPYPPSWQAVGVNLKNLRFVHSSSPVRDLKPLFIDGFFRLIILDHPINLSAEDCCFLSQQARAHRLLIIILRDYLLTPASANVWARLRLNTWLNPENQKLELEAVRGLKNSYRSSFYL